MKKLKIESDTRLTVTEDTARWSFTSADQAEKHLATFAAVGGKLPAGDVSAIRDAANDARKERAKQ